MGVGFTCEYHPLGDGHTTELASFKTSDQESTDKDIENRGAEDESYDRGKVTRILALTGLVLSWILGIICIVLGSGSVLTETESFATKHRDHLTVDSMLHNWPQLKLSQTAGELLPLLTNAVITLLIEGMGLIHATTLRWALGDKLIFNSNLRLFTSGGQRHISLGWLSNLIHVAFIIIAYAGASLMFASPPSETFCKSFSSNLGASLNLGCGDLVVLATPSLCILGVGLLGQAILVTWQFSAVNVPTWSSNPLDTAWASAALGTRTRVPGRCMMSVHDAKTPSKPQSPKPKQKCAWTAHRQIRIILCYIWAMPLLGFAAVGIIQHTLVSYYDSISCIECNSYLGTSWSLLRDSGDKPMSAAVITEADVLNYGYMFAFYSAFQGFFTLALHCAELVASMNRDESTWRKCYTQHLYSPRPNALLRAATNWVTVILFIFKILLHWLFGNAISYAYNWGLFVRPPPFLYLSIGSLCLSVVLTFSCCQRPKGEQPATFGHVQTLVNLVDEWHLQMYWGDKGEGLDTDRVRHAGTASVPLGMIMKDVMYEG